MHMAQLIPLSPPSSLASLNSRLVNFYGAGLSRLSWKKRPLNWYHLFTYSYSIYIRCLLSVKIIAVDKGFYIPGGTQLYGKFLTLKTCMKACALAPSCFSADYNPWLRKCYQHSNYTACNTRRSHTQFVHFSKVPCSKYSYLQWLKYKFGGPGTLKEFGALL